MPTISANDLEVGYEVTGDGPPLVFLHAASSAGRVDFAAQIPVLATRFRLHLPDARGHGATRWDAGLGFQADWLVDDLEAFADVLGLDSMHLVGFSMGAMTALLFTVRHPGRVRSLVLAGISPEREPRASIVRRLLDPERIDRDDPDWAMQLGRRHDPVQGSHAWRRLLPAIADDVRAQRLLSPRELHSVGVPALVMCGDRDPFVPVHQAWRLARQLGNGHLLVAPDCGHEVLSTRSDLANVAVASFYRSIESVVREPNERLPEVSR